METQEQLDKVKLVKEKLKKLIAKEASARDIGKGVDGRPGEPKQLN